MKIGIPNTLFSSYHLLDEHTEMSWARSEQRSWRGNKSSKPGNSPGLKGINN
jgi:hypothetical protein